MVTNFKYQILMTSYKPLKIRSELVAMGVTNSHIAKELGVSRQAVTQTIYNESKSRRIRLAIAEALQRPVEQVWPDEDPATPAERRQCSRRKSCQGCKR
jgi:DNA-binding XRE family transcriptional regulator